jgi:hypothetical protein
MQGDDRSFKSGVAVLIAVIVLVGVGVFAGTFLIETLGEWTNAWQVQTDVDE